VERAASGHEADRQQIADVEVIAVSDNCVDLGFCVLAAHMTSRRPAEPREVDDHDIALPRRPLALNPQQAIADLKREVVPAVLADRSQDADSEACRCGDDLRFGDVAFEIGIVRAHARTIASHPWPNNTRMCRTCG
jgi:hypothetical protein